MTESQTELLVVEYWDVPAESQPAFLEYYQGIVFRALSRCTGYEGMTVTTRRQTSIFGASGPRKAIAPHLGMNTMGVRTDAMIDFDALLQHEYNFVGVHYWRDKTILGTALVEQFMAGWEMEQPNWRADNPDLSDPWDVLIRDFVGLCENHWDVFYEVQASLWNANVLTA